MSAEALRVFHNLAGRGGARVHNPLPCPYAGRTKIAYRLRRPFRRNKCHSSSTCTQALTDLTGRPPAQPPI
jgi:hypothetical protein